MAIAFILIAYNIFYSIKNSPRNVGDDPWNARSLEWATHNPVPEYNFAIEPEVNSSEAFWDHKKKKHTLFKGKIDKIHMPNNSGIPIIMAGILFVFGFSFVFSIWPAVIIAAIAFFACMMYSSFENDQGRYISADEVKETEEKFGGASK